jgi:hypothetical protein
MARVLVHVEGQTEESFVNEVLAPHLLGVGYQKVGARLIGNPRHQRGGIKGWNTVREEISRHLREDPGCLMTTMVDYYALPQTGIKAWPGRAQAGGLPAIQRAASVEAALVRDLAATMGPSFNPAMFLPFVVIHEFEALLFSDCHGFANGIGRPDLASRFQAVRDEFGSPEEINDSPLTAPSKRVTTIVAGYQKPFMGTLAALTVGLETMRVECPHFRAWIERLEFWPRRA